MAQQRAGRVEADVADPGDQDSGIGVAPTTYEQARATLEDARERQLDPLIQVVEGDADDDSGVLDILPSGESHLDADIRPIDPPEMVDPLGGGDLGPDSGTHEEADAAEEDLDLP